MLNSAFVRRAARDALRAGTALSAVLMLAAPGHAMARSSEERTGGIVVIDPQDEAMDPLSGKDGQEVGRTATGPSAAEPQGDRNIQARTGSRSAVRVPPGTLLIANSGAIEGAVTLSDGDDQVTNTGELVMTADNDFGLGSDLFTNKGVVRFGKAPVAQRFGFLGLERFANDGGLIDLHNERAGDTLTLSGAYAATGDARLALDIDGEAFDSLVIGGAVTGRTTVALKALQPEDAVLFGESVSLITVEGGARADAFTLVDADQGLVRYELRFDEKARAFQLDASAGLAVHRSVRAVEGLRTAWRGSAEAFEAEQAMARAAGGESGRVWAIGHGSATSRDADEAAFALAYDQTLVGGQLGASIGARPFAGGQAAWGLTGGYAGSSLSFEDQGPKIEIETLNLGGYGAWRSGNAFATALLKVDTHALEIDDPAAGFEAELNGLSWGGRFEAGFRFDLGGLALEPVVGLDYLSTTLDDLEVLGQSVAFDDQKGFSTRVGGQAIARTGLADGRAVLFSAGLEFVHDFEVEQRGVLHSNGQTDEAVLTGPRNYGRALVGAQFDMGGGWQTYAQGEGRFGEGQSGGGLRLGARFRF